MPHYSIMTYYLQAGKKKSLLIKKIQLHISYSCFPNFPNTIKSYNNRISSEEVAQSKPKCNCRQRDTCPLEGNCLNKEIIYQCNLKESTISGGVNYNGFAENTFKSQFYKHRNSVRYECKTNSNELSKHFWEMKRNGMKTQSCIGQSLIMRNHIRISPKGATYVLLGSSRILTQCDQT